MIKKGILTLSVAGLGTLAFAQTTHTVAPSGGDFTSIEAALNDAGTASGDIIEVEPGTYLSEQIVINKEITIRGTNANNRPVIGVEDAGTGIGTNDGIVIILDGAVTLENLILIPDPTTKPADDVIAAQVANSTDTLDLTVTNVLITANDGSNGPLQTSFDENPDLGAGGLIFFNDDPFYVMTRTAFGGNNGIVNTTLTDLHMLNWTTSTGGDFIVYPADAGDNSVHNWDGIRIVGGGDTQFSAATGSDFVVNDYMGRDGAGTGFAAFQGNSWTLTNIYIDNYSAFGIEADSDTVLDFSLDGAQISNTGAEGFWTGYATQAGVRTWSISNATFYACGSATATPPIAAIKAEADVTSDLTIEVTDSIVAGPYTAVENLGAGAINFINCGLVTAGADALDSVVRSTTTGTVGQTNVINDDPDFVSTTPFGTDSFDVNATAYSLAASGGGPLSGGADYVGTSDVDKWNLYAY